MKHLSTRIITVLALLLALCLPAGAFAVASAPSAGTVDALAGQIAAYESAQLAALSGGPTYGNEWALMALARAGKLPDTLKQQYLNNLALYLKAHGGSLGSTVTDYDRVILALTAMGVDATSFNGIDLTAPLADLTAINSQGVSGTIYALLALDSHAYPIPTLAAGSSGTQTTRPALVQAVVAAQLSGGGWNWGFGTAADPDLTSMALCALAPYYHGGDSAVDAAVDDGLAQLSAIQDDATAGFAADWAPAPGSESSAQALVALSSLGIGVDDARFVKAGGSLYDSLAGFAIDAGSGAQAFVDYAGDTTPSGMATEQGLYALVALSRSLTGANRLYDMTDVTLAPFVLKSDDGGGGTPKTPGTPQKPALDKPAAESAAATGSNPLPQVGDGTVIATLSLAAAALAAGSLLVATGRRSWSR